MDFIRQKKLFGPNDRILLAVSGGLDSVCLAHLFARSPFTFAIAHCNFQLRDRESEAEASFVESLATAYEVPFFGTHFDTRKIADQDKTGIQETARRLRYTWFETLLEEEGFQFLATGHHLDDSLETQLFNLSKGTGIRGLRGILPKRAAYIRPLLFATRAELEAYQEEFELAYREDSSNRELYYQRNKIRQQIVPVLRQINPNLSNAIRTNQENLEGVERLYHWAVQHWREALLTETDQKISIDIARLLGSPSPPTLLFELLRPFQFHRSQISRILEACAGQPGPIFYGGTHALLVDRDQLILQARDLQTASEKWIEAGVSKVELPEGRLYLQAASFPDKWENNPKVAYLNAGEFQYPLLLRHWQEGDSFYPLGMQGKRKTVKNYFSDLKVDRFNKNRIWILESSGQICWIIGYRADERYKISKDTVNILRLEYVSKP